MQQTVVLTWHDLSGTVNAGFGRAGVFAHDGITGSITAGGDVYAATWGAISAPVIGTGANQPVEVFARKDVSANVTSLGSLTVTAGGDVNGTMQAGSGASHNALISALGISVGGTTANGAVSGTVTAGGAATVYAKGDVIGTVQGTSGNASVITRGGFQGMVTAGVDANLATGNAITSATVTAGQDANVSAHDAVSSTNITADRNASLWAKGAISGSTVLGSDFGSGSYQPGTASVSSLTSLSSVTAKAGDDVSMYSGGSLVNGTAVSSYGSVTASALATLDGMFNAGTGVTLVSLASITSGTSVIAGTYQPGTVDLFAGQNINGNYLVTGNAIASAMQDTKGTYLVLSGTATLFAGDTADASVSADNNVVVYAGSQIKNSLTSLNGEVTAGISGVTGGGAMSATIQAQMKATVTNLLGDVTGGITVNDGGADITADGQLTSAVTTTNGAIVANMTGTISSGTLTANNAAIDLATLQDISSAVNANAGTMLTAWAGLDIGGTLSATGNVNLVSQTEDVAGTVTSSAGDVSISALKTVSATVTANQNASVYALDGISGSVTTTAGDATVVALDGPISGSINAGDSLLAFAMTNIGGGGSGLSAGSHAEIMAFGNLNAMVVAGGDVTVILGGSTTASISAGWDVSLSALGGVNSPVAAGQDASVVVFGPIAGSITATRDANVFTAAAMSGNILAGNDANLFTGGGSNNVVNAGNDANVTSLSGASGLVSGGRDVSVLAFGVVAGAVLAGRNAEVASLLSANTALVTATLGDANLFAYGLLNSMTLAGGDVSATSFGTLQGSYTGADVSVFSVVGMPTINVNASGNASAVSWGSVSGPANIDGDSSATLWAAGNIDGSVTSSLGSAAAISFGNITSLAGINGATDAVAMSVGDFFGSVSAGSGLGGLITLGSFAGGSVLGSDAIVLAQGSLNGSVTAGNDAVAFSIGDFGGSVFAMNDATVASYGTFLSSASVTANRDITDVWAAGDINGSFNATRNIGEIMSYGSINASFTATGTPGDSETGNIGNTTAVGSIAGSFTAGTSIGNLLAGGTITATLSAPTIGSITDNDAATASLTPPAGPMSATAAVLASLAIAQGMMTQSVTDYFTEATQLLSDSTTLISNAQLDATNAWNLADANLTANNAQLRTDATNAYNDTVTATNDAYTQARGEANAAWNELQTAVGDLTTAAMLANSDAQTASADLLLDLDGQLATIALAMAVTDQNMMDDRTDAIIQTSGEIIGHEAQWNRDWWEYYGSRLQTIENWVGNAQMATVPFMFFPATAPFAIYLSMGLGVINLTINLVQGDGLGIAFATVDVATSGIAGKVKGGFRALGGAAGKTDEVVTVVSRVANECFVVGTPTDVAANDREAQTHSEWFFCLTGCGALVLLSIDHERKRRKRTADIDRLFADDPWDDLWEPE